MSARSRSRRGLRRADLAGRRRRRSPDSRCRTNDRSTRRRRTRSAGLRHRPHQCTVLSETPLRATNNATQHMHAYAIYRHEILSAIKSINYVINSTFRKIFNTRSQDTVDVCLEMFGCLQAERTIAIRKRKFLNKFSVIHNALCRVFVAIAKTEFESCCTDV